MDFLLSAKHIISGKSITITGSKSETNRLLLLQALNPGIVIYNASESDDSMMMRNALGSESDVVDIHHAGTAMRFLTAYFAQLPGREVLLTGSPRMKERPIAVLAEALCELGADISFPEREGFPPLFIKGVKLDGGIVKLRADVSSQYITALLLIAPLMKNGLTVQFDGRPTSLPYIKMTVSLLKEAGVAVEMYDDRIEVLHSAIAPCQFTVESDWSSASYFYSLIALSPSNTSVTLSSYKKDSLQGDSALVQFYEGLGVRSVFRDNSITLIKVAPPGDEIALNLANTPDIAQTIAVTCFGLGIGCTLTGLHTLRIKETDRLAALKNELGKFGAKVTVIDDSLTLAPGNLLSGETGRKTVRVATYNDHRMAMAFAPLALKTPLIIEDAGVVSKSFPSFWDDLKTLGFSVMPESE